MLRENLARDGVIAAEIPILDVLMRELILNRLFMAGTAKSSLGRLGMDKSTGESTDTGIRLHVYSPLWRRKSRRVDDCVYNMDLCAQAV